MLTKDWPSNLREEPSWARSSLLYRFVSQWELIAFCSGKFKVTWMVIHRFVDCASTSLEVPTDFIHIQVCDQNDLQVWDLTWKLCSILCYVAQYQDLSVDMTICVNPTRMSFSHSCARQVASGCFIDSLICQLLWTGKFPSMFGGT